MHNHNLPQAPNLFFQILMVFSLPLYFISHAGVFIGLAWLLVIGSWKVLIFGFLIGIAGNVVLPFLYLPSTVFINYITNKSQTSRLNITIGLTISSIYNAIASAGYCLWVLWVLLTMSPENAIIPTLFWVYGVATTPFIRLTKLSLNTEGETVAMFSTFFIQFSLAVASVLYFLSENFTYTGTAFCGIYFALTFIYHLATDLRANT